MLTKVKRSEGNYIVIIKGDINEHCEPELFAALEQVKDHTILDCAEINSLNSIGVRSWVKFVEALRDKVTFELVNCTPVFLEYANLLPKLFRTQKIYSVLLPLECDACGKSGNYKFLVDEIKELDQLPENKCKKVKCKGVMRAGSELDWYLGFARTADENDQVIWMKQE